VTIQAKWYQEGIEMLFIVAIISRDGIAVLQELHYANSFQKAIDKALVLAYRLGDKSDNIAELLEEVEKDGNSQVNITAKGEDLILAIAPVSLR
jgi:hypothetical protein